MLQSINTAALRFLAFVIDIYTLSINPLPLRVAVVDGILMMESHPLTGTDSKAIEDHPIILFLLDKLFDLLVQDCPAEVRYAQDIGCSEFRFLRKEVDEEVPKHIILVIASASRKERKRKQNY